MMLLLLALLPVALAQEPPVGTVVYVHSPDGGPPWPVSDIYLNGKALTNDGHSHTPAWSPDGRRILFIHDSDSYRPVELFVMDRDGGNQHLLRRLEPGIFSAAWSPDGKTLAITAQSTGPARAGLFLLPVLLPADGQGEPRLLFRDAFTPSWSPDGKKLAFSVESPRGQWAVHVADSDGSNDVQLTDPNLIGGSPAWSPDGKQIAFDQFVGGRKQQIFVMDADGSRKLQVTKDANWSCEHPSWSADGEQIAFACRSASALCGTGVSSTGSILPPCTRRIFAISRRDPKSPPMQLEEHDAAFPAFAP